MPSSAHIKILFFLCIGCWPSNLLSQFDIETANFRHIGIADGLANPQVRSMLKGQRGFIWLGTVNGLVRYDGLHFKNYYHIYGDSTSISNNEIRGLVEDKDGFIYIGTAQGLNRFDPRTETFKAFFDDHPGDHVSQMSVQCLHYDGDKKIYIGEITRGLYVFDIEKEVFENYCPFPLKPTWQANREQNCVYSIHPDMADPDLLWLGMRKDKLFSFRKSTRQLREQYNPKIKHDSGFQDIIQNEPGVLWLGRYNGGIARFEVATGRLEEFYLDPKKYPKGTYGLQLVRELEWKSNHEIWVPFQEEGLWVFNTRTRSYQKMQPNLSNPRGWQSLKMHDVQSTHDGLTWFVHSKPTEAAITIYDPSANILTPFTISPTANTDQIPNYPMDMVFRESDQRYYLAIKGDQVQAFDKNWNYEYSLPLYSEPGKEQLYWSLYLDSQDRLWVNRKYQVWRLNDEKRQIEKFDIKSYGKLSFNGQFFISMLEGKDQNIWLGSVFSGLVKLDFKKDTLYQYADSTNTESNIAFNQRIHKIKEDINGHLWMATYSGLVKFDPIKEKFSYWQAGENELEGLVHNNIYDLEFDAQGRLWLVFTQGGVQVFDPTTEKFIRHYTRQDGLPTERIEKVTRDSNGQIWLSSVLGLIRYREVEDDFIFYGFADGIQETWVADHMASLDHKGWFYLGGVQNTFHRFHPDNLFTPPPPPIVFTGFKVHNEDYLRDTSIDFQKHIVLDYLQNNVTFEFAALNFHLPKKNRYAWQLEGVDKEWVYPKESRQSVNYTNLAPGKYTFRIKASNNEQVWNEEGRSIRLTITPPWWQTRWAYTTYVLLAMALLAGAFRLQRRRLNLQANLQLEQEEASRLKELDEVKSRMYANVTHEFRTPVTVILGMADEIRRRPEEQLYNRLGLIERNGRKLLGLVNQLLNMTRLEAGVLEYKPVCSDVVAFLREMVEGFRPFADSRELGLLFQSEMERLEMDFDPEKLERAMANLLSNAIKFTETGSVQVGISIKDNSLIINVKDTGIGISPEDLPKVFDRFYQTDASTARKWEGTGIGLSLAKDLVELMGGNISVKSDLGQGAVFTILFLIRQEAKQSDQPSPNTPLQKQAPVIGLPANAQEQSEQPFNTSDENSTPPLLLLIEDNRDIVEYLTICLREHYRLEIAFDGAEGLEKAFHLIPDIVLSDVMMPEKDGFEVCRTLKNDERTSHVPIVLLTAKAAVDDRLRGLRRGADAYLSKPFYKEELLVRLEQLVALRAKLQARYAHLSPPPEPVEEAFTQEDGFMQKVNALLDSHLSNADLSAEAFAQQIFLSRMQLHRKLKALTGRSTTAYIRWYRLCRSKELLEKTNWPIGRIALETGFSDVNYFSRSFDKEFGVRPSGYREQGGVGSDV